MSGQLKKKLYPPTFNKSQIIALEEVKIILIFLPLLVSVYQDSIYIRIPLGSRTRLKMERLNQTKV